MGTDEEILSLFSAEDNRTDTSGLRFYNKTEEKKSTFGPYIRYESSTEFMHFINHGLPKLLGTQKAVYRGLSSGRYRLFNKAQRSFASNKFNTPMDEDVTLSFPCPA